MNYSKETKDFYFFQPLKRNPDAVRHEEMYSLDEEKLYLTGGWSRELENAIEKSGVSRIVVQHWSGRNLDFLSKFASQIRQLWIEAHIEDVTAVNSLGNLEDLSLAGQVEQIDFSRLRKLQKCDISARDTIGNIGACPKLRELILVSAQIENLTDLSRLALLKSLDLQEISLQSLDGIGRLPQLGELFLRQVGLSQLDGLEHADGLRYLMLTHMPKLKSIGALTGMKKLTHLDVDSCKKIEDLDVVGQIPTLQKLDLENLGKVPSLSFLRRMRRLKEFSFWESTNIVDGNLAVLLSLPNLKRVGFKNRKHYSHTMDQLNQRLESRR